MLTYALEKNGSSSLYTQLYGCIRRDILSGALPPRQKLPSKRALAQHLEVSVITVKNAYEQLAAEGYIYTVEKKGYYVSPLESPAPGGSAAPGAGAPAEPVFLDLATGSLDRSYFPFTVWSRLMRQTILEEDTELLRSTPYNGAPALRRAIAAHLRQFRGHGRGPGADHHRRGNGAFIHPHHPAAGPGQAVRRGGPGLRQDRQDLSGPPGAPVPGRPGRRGAGHHAAAPPAGGRGTHLAVPSLSHGYRHAHNPPPGAAALAAEQPERYILEDDYDSEFRFVGRPIPTLFSVSENQRSSI